MGAAASRTRVAWAAGLLQPRDGTRDADTGTFADSTWNDCRDRYTFERDSDPEEYADIHREGDERDRHDCRLGQRQFQGSNPTGALAWSVRSRVQRSHLLELSRAAGGRRYQPERHGFPICWPQTRKP